MLTFAALFLAAPAAPAPEVEMLNAFREVCWSVPDTQRIADTAVERGWTAVPRGKHAGADRVRAAVESGAKDDYRVTVRQFERLVGDRLLLLTIHRGELAAAAAEGFGSTDCQIRELSEPRPISMALAEEWVGRPADEVLDDEDGPFRSWYSHRRLEPTNLIIAYFPPESSLVGEEMMPGIYLNALSYGDRSDVPRP